MVGISDDKADQALAEAEAEAEAEARAPAAGEAAWVPLFVD
ncbi:regulator of protease activity HflC (stomatin/prohibitin superfamily) [Streptacidiphilus sp. BW17]